MFFLKCLDFVTSGYYYYICDTCRQLEKHFVTKFTFLVNA